MSKTANKDITKFELPVSRIVRLVPVVRSTRFMNKEGHDGAFMFMGASNSFVLPMSSSTRKFIDPLTKEEREFLEKELLLNLNVNSAPKYEKGKLVSGNVYGEYRITIKKTSENLDRLWLELDLSRPDDYLKYKILLKCPNVAPDWESREDTPEYVWALRDKGQEFKDKSTSVTKRLEAYNWLTKASSNKIKMVDYLRLLGENVTGAHSIDELTVIFDRLINDANQINNILDLIKDKNLNGKIFVDKAMRLGEVKKLAYGRYTTRQGEMLGASIEEVIAHFKDPSNQVFKLRIEDMILKENM